MFGPPAAGCVVAVGFNPRLFHLPKKGGAEGEVEDKLSSVFALGSQDKRISGERGGAACAPRRLGSTLARAGRPGEPRAAAPG